MQGAAAKNYFLRRAAEERAAAEQALDDRAAQSHRELADRYEQQANGAADCQPDAVERLDGTLAKEFRILP